MANPESKKLAVDVIARVDKLEKEMKKAARAANENFSKIERGGKRMADKIERDIGGAVARVGGRLKAFGAGLLGGLTAGGITGIVSQLGEVAKGIATIGDEAKRAGVSVEAFQAWKFVAEQARMPVDSLIDGLKELNLRADELIVTGTGPAAEAFARLGYSAADLKTKLADPSALMLEIIGRLGQLEKAAQIRIADEIFGGTGGERFVELISQGEAGIRDTIGRAHELGAVMDGELIEKAAELDRRFNAITTSVGTGLKTAIVEAASALQGFIDKFQTWFNKLPGRQSDLGTSIGSLAGRLVGGGPNRTTAKTDRLPAAPFTPLPLPGGGATRDAAAEKAKREADAVRDLIAELEREKRLIGATDLERELSNQLRQAGAAATADQRAKIVALVTAIDAETKALEGATDAASAMSEAGRDALGGMIDDLRAGKSAADAFAGALNRVADRLLDSTLTGLFGGGGNSGGSGVIGKLLGFASGTANTGGSRGQVRGVVHGQEAVIPLPNGGKIPVDIRMPKVSGGSAGGSGANITYAPVIDARGADSAAVAKLAAVVAQDKRDFAANVKIAIEKQNKLGGFR